MFSENLNFYWKFNMIIHRNVISKMFLMSPIWLYKCNNVHFLFSLKKYKKHGHLQSLTDILKIHGIGQASAKKLCKNIVDGKKKIVKAKSSVKSAVLTPSLGTNQHKVKLEIFLKMVLTNSFSYFLLLNTIFTNLL